MHLDAKCIANTLSIKNIITANDMTKLKTMAIIFATAGLTACAPHNGHDAAAHDQEATESSTNAAYGEDSHQGLIVLDRHRAGELGITVSTATRRPFARIIRATGYIEAPNDGQASVAASASGIIDFDATIVEGMQVATGQQLLTINSSQIIGGNANEKAKNDYDIALNEYRRIKDLYEEQLVTRAEYVTAKKAYEDARIAYQPLRTSDSAGRQGVRSPMAGFVKECLVKEGDYVTAGQQLMTIAKSDRLHLVAEVSERYAGELKGVRSANFRTAYSDQTYSTDALDGRLISVGKSVGNTSFHIPVIFSIRNDGSLVEGSYSEIFLMSQSSGNVFTVPKTALIEEEGNYYIYKEVSEGHYKKQMATLGGEDGINVEIVTGLNEGDKVVTTGAYQLKLAASVSVIPPHTHEH